MLRYFLVNGYIPLAHEPRVGFGPSRGETRSDRVGRYKRSGIELPKLGETIFLRKAKVGRISLFVHGAYDAFILIVSTGQKNAYLLGNGLRAALTCFDGHSPQENPSGYLLELNKFPSMDMTHNDLAVMISAEFSQGEFDIAVLESQLRTGTGLDHIQLKQGCSIVDKALNYPRLRNALMHLEYSRTLVWGYMVGSYYESHDSYDRRKLSRYQMEKRYLENRPRYDSAFVSAFRGLECLLGVPHFRQIDISTLLVKTDRTFGTSFSRDRYRSWHEVFSSRQKWWKRGDLIAYYLKLRNAVAAHGNLLPPHIVMEDQVFEIQYLVQDMLGHIFWPEMKCELEG